MNTEKQSNLFVPESQKERWVKYGANVALASVVVIILAGAVVYLAQKFDRRIDTTSAGLYSLKPQTINLIKANKQKIKLVSLYAALEKRPDRDDNAQSPIDAGAIVRDLLEEYSRKGTNIEFQAIDPVTQPTDGLVQEAITKYGGAVKAYKDFLEEFNRSTYEKLNALTKVEAAGVAEIPTESLGEDEKGQMIAAVVNTIRENIPQNLTRMKERTDRAVKAKFPDYKALVDQIRTTLDSVSRTENAIVKFAAQLKDDEKSPQALRTYLSQSMDRHAAILKLADDGIKQIDGLGELKVSDLQDAIKGQDLILVLGEKDWRVINPEQVWKQNDQEVRMYLQGGEKPKPRFAGEQAVTTAILSLTTDTKPKVVFVRPGGGPLTNPGFPPFQRGGVLSEVAARLRDYNFDVLEKDLSGMWAMQAQMQGQQAAPEPSDEEIKDAVWIVLDTPSQPGAPPPPVAAKLAEHLGTGGSAMVLAMPRSDALTDVMKDYGIQIVTDAAIVHEVPTGDRGRSSDMSEEVQRLPFVIVTNQYGDTTFTQPLKSLDSLLAFAVPVRTNPAPGAKVSSFLPIPENVKVWGERNIDSLDSETPKFETTGPNADLPPPFFAGAVAERDKSRLVVIGGLQTFMNQILNWPDEEMRKRGVLVARFPGNGELFTNAIFWLSKMEPMIAISPSAMEVSRISPMNDYLLLGWRVGVLLILLPGAILAAGIWMYFARRD